MVKSYNEMTVGQYLQIQQVSKKEMEDIDYHVALISILTGKPEDEIIDLPIMEFKSLDAGIAFVAEDMPLATGAVRKSYKVGGYELIPIKAISDMTAAQYIDFQVLSKNPDENVAQILSVFLVPKGHIYNRDYDIEDVQEKIKEGMTIIDANEILTFFLQRFLSLISSTLIYSGWMAKRMKEGPEKTKVLLQIKEAKRILTENGDGLQTLMQFRKPAGAVGRK